MSTTFISAMVPMSGSSDDSKIILLVGGISVVTLLLVVVVVICIRGAVIIKIKKQVGYSKKASNLYSLVVINWAKPVKSKSYAHVHRSRCHQCSSHSCRVIKHIQKACL